MGDWRLWVVILAGLVLLALVVLVIVLAVKLKRARDEGARWWAEREAAVARADSLADELERLRQLERERKKTDGEAVEDLHGGLSGWSPDDPENGDS